MASTRVEDSTELLCGACRRDEYAFDRARSFGLYSHRLRKAILLLKFQRRERWGAKLGSLLVHTWQEVNPGFKEPVAIVAPVPLHEARQRERGFNQAELLARGLIRAIRHSGMASPPLLELHALRRTQPTLPQSGLGQHARRENVRGVFSADAARVRERTVFLVDDVMTTGATASACARVLKAAGAECVVVVTLARATPQFPDGVEGGKSRVDDSTSPQT